MGRSTLAEMSHTDRDLKRLAERVGRHLLSTRRTVATAESCTGGFIAKAMTDVAGSSAWVLEGFVTYSNDAKMRSLAVPPTVLRRFGAVSEATVRAMVRGALRNSGASIAVAVTGIAGPGGAVPGKPVGTVWIAWAFARGRGIRVDVQLKRFRGNRDSVRRKTVQTALVGLLAR